MDASPAIIRSDADAFGATAMPGPRAEARLLPTAAGRRIAAIAGPGRVGSPTQIGSRQGASRVIGLAEMLACLHRYAS